MPVSQMRNGLTAEKSIFSQKPSINVPRSKFDFGRLNLFTSDIGMIVPVDVFPTLPNEDFDLSCQYKIDWRPLIVPTLTSYKAKVHYYYCPNEYLWSGWETFASKGRSGNQILSIPKLKLSQLVGPAAASQPTMSGLTDPNFSTDDGTYLPYVPHSLISYMVGCCGYNTVIETNEDGSVAEGFINDHYLPFGYPGNGVKLTGYHAVDTNILPFIMYQKIFRSNYLDPNLYDNGVVEQPVWFPVDIDSSHWRANYGATNIFGTYNEFFVPDTITSNPSSPVANFVPIADDSNSGVSGDTAVNLTQLRYSMFTDDMFTTALPFLQRGPQTPLDLDVIDSVIENVVNGDGAYISGNPALAYRAQDDNLPSPNRSTGNLEVNSNGSIVIDGSISSTMHLVRISGELKGVSVSSSLTGAKVTLTAQRFRDLMAVSVWQERNALTNGSYGQFIKVHFGSYPDNNWCEPIYIGGTTSVFNVSAVLQTSESNKTPLGNPAGIGGSSGSQSIGHFRSPDYGFIMVLLTVIPDTVYVQSNEHWQFEETPSDLYSPEFEKLSYQAIQNKMIASGFGEDNDLFGYMNRYVYLKQRDTIARGMFSLPSEVDAYYHSYVQSRIFKDTPKLSQQFVTVYPPNIDRSMLAYPGEPCFLCQFYSGVEKVSPLSYVSQPNTFGF